VYWLIVDTYQTQSVELLGSVTPTQIKAWALSSNFSSASVVGGSKQASSTVEGTEFHAFDGGPSAY